MTDAFRFTKAVTTLPHFSSGRPTTATSATAGWRERQLSISTGARFLAAGDDHVVDAALYEQVAVVVDVTRVTREVPALAQRFRVCVGASPIALERLVARQQRDDLALFIGGREFVDRPSLETDDLDTLVDSPPCRRTRVWRPRSGRW